ncbi:MAG: universal stress protein [Methylohalobius sp. ZOD2]|nr:universal stress protein [Methylothermaceae bacterium]
MYHKILIAIAPDQGPEAKAAIETGLNQLEEDGELHLATVVSPEGTAFFPHVPEQSPEELEAEARDGLDLLVRKYLPLNRNAQLHVAHGEAGQALVALAGSLDADLLILASQGSSPGRWTLRRNTAEYVTVNAPCPVLVLADSESRDSEEG